MAANQVDFKILPSDQFSVYSPQTRSDKVITYFTLLSKLRGDILSVGQDDDPNDIVSAFYSSVGGTQTLHLVKADGSEITASVPEPTVGTVTSVNLTASTGISVSGGPITTSGSITVTNTAPDQVVVLTGAGTTSISGTYPSFTITSNDQFVGTVTSVSTTAPITGGTITNTGTIGITQSGAAADGYLSSTDWTTFNSKEPALTKGNLTEATSSVLTITGGTGAVIGSGTTIQVSQATTTTSGFLSSADWTTFNGKQGTITLTTTGTTGAATFISNTLNIPNYADQFVGTVTSVAALTIGTTGTDLSSTVVDSTTTPVITLQVPTASAANRGALSSADWTTFNSKEPALTKGNLTEATSAVLTITGGTGAVIGTGTSIQVAQSGVSTSGFLSSADWTTFNSKQSALTFSAPLVNTSGTVSIPAATSLVDGYLSATDFATFNGKQNALTLTTTGTTGAATLIGATLNIPNYADQFVGTVTSVDLTASTGISVSGGPITSSGSITVTNTAPDQVVSLTGGTGITTSGTYPSFTVTNSDRGSSQNIFKNIAVAGQSTIVADVNDDTLTVVAGSGVTITTNDTTDTITISATGSGGSVTSVATTAPITGGTFTTTGTIGITQSGAAADGYLSSTDWGTFNSKQPQLNGTGFVKASGTTISYDNNTYYLDSNPSGFTSNTGTVTSVGLTGGTGITISGGPITSSGSITVTNSAPDQVVALTASTGISITGTYPNFTITNTSAGGGTITGSGTTNYVPKWTSASAIGNSAIYDNAGNIGIGNTAPNQKLELSVGSSVTGGLRINYDATATSEGMDITYLNSGNTTTSFDSRYNSDSAVMQFRMKTASTAVNAMTILGNGNVGINTTAPTQKLDVSGNIMVLGLKNTNDYFEKILGDVSFANGDANKAFNIILGNSGVWGYIEVEVNSTYNHQSSAGKLTKRFAIGTSPGNLIYVNESRVSDAMGTIVDNIAIGNFAWDGAISSYVIPISHIVSTGNAYNVRVRCYSQGGGASTVFAALSLSAVYTFTALARQYPYYNDRLGIGTAGPTSRFQVNNNAGTGSAFYVDAGNPSGTTTLFEHTGANTPVAFAITKSGYSGSSVDFGILYIDMAHSVVGGGSNMHFTLRNSIGNQVEYGGLGASIVTNTAASESGRLNFYTTNAGATRNIRMVISPAGNVGIGTTSPGTRFTVVETSSTNPPLSIQNTNVDGYSGSWIYNSAGTLVAHFGWANGTTTALSDKMYFGTIANKPVVFTTNDAERLRITSDGNVGIGTTSPSYKLDVTGDIRVNTGALGVNVAPSATDGRIDASNDIVAFSSSDLRLKENIKPIENALEKVKSLTGVEFDWKPELKHAHGYEGHDTGVIAQEVQEVMPTAIRTNDTGYLAVRYEKLIGLLIEANKELAARVEELESKLK